MPMSALEFRSRFNPEEKVRLEMASLDDPTALMEQRLQAAALRVYLADLAAVRDDVDENDTRTVEGVRTLEAVGLLDYVGRADEILAPAGTHQPGAVSFSFPADHPVPGAFIAVVTAGAYLAHDLVECYAIGDETRAPVAAYSALYIATGEN